MDTIKNVTQLLIGKDIAPTGLLLGVLVNDVNQLADGEIVMTTPTNLITDGTVAEPQVKFIQRSGKLLIHSDLIDVRNPIRQYNIGTGEDELQQRDYVGWNGVSGELDEIPNNIYTVRLYCYGSGNTHEFMQQDIKRGTYKSHSTPLQGDIAAGLVKSLISNMSRDAEKTIRVAMVGDVAGTVTTGTVTVSQNSYFVQFSVDEGLTVGTYLRFGTNLDSWIAKVIAWDAANLVAEVNVPYDSVTETKAIAGAEFDVIPVNFGVVLAGVETDFVLGKFKSEVVTWETTIDFGDESAVTYVTNTQTPYAGVGTQAQIATLEKELQSDEYQYRMFIEGAPTDRTDAIIPDWNYFQGVYDVQVIEHDHVLSAAQGTPTKSPKTLEIAWRNPGNTQAGVIVAQWEALLTLIGTPFVEQVGNLTP